MRGSKEEIKDSKEPPFTNTKKRREEKAQERMLSKKRERELKKTKLHVDAILTLDIATAARPEILFRGNVKEEREETDDGLLRLP